MTEVDRTVERTALAKVVLFLVAAAAVGFVVSLIGHFADWKGFDDGGESTTAGSTFWFLYFFSGIAALVAGVVALVKGMRSGNVAERNAGRLAVAFVVCTVALLVIVDSFD
jgi:di/tricarboxylate transporter